MAPTNKHRLPDTGDNDDAEDSHKLQIGVGAMLNQASLPIRLNNEVRNIAQRQLDESRLSVVQTLNKGK